MSDESPNPITASQPPAFEADQRHFFAEVLKALNDSEVPYAVSGAFALHHCTGIWRGLKDLDVCLPAAAVAPAGDLAKQRGFFFEPLDPVWIAKIRCGKLYVDLITGMSNGVLAVNPSWIDRARSVNILGIQTRVLAPEELLASKLFIARRDRFDGADVAHIIFRTGDRLDWDRILSLVGEHWELLLWSLIFFRYAYPGYSCAVPAPVWRSLLGKFQEQVRQPALTLPFRGSLIDDRAFAIDVNDWKLDDLYSKYRERAVKFDAEPMPLEPPDR